MNKRHKNDIHVTPVAAGVRLYANANFTHGILQLVTEQATAEDMEPQGDHVVAQVAFDPDQLRTLAEQLVMETVAKEILPTYR